MTSEERSYLASHIASLKAELREAVRLQRKQISTVAKRNHALLRRNAKLRAEANLNSQVILLVREVRQIAEVVKELLDKREVPHAESQAVSREFLYQQNKTL